MPEPNFCHNLSSNNFYLWDSQKITRLIEIAIELNLTVSFNGQKQGEFCFTKNNYRPLKSITVVDNGTTITVSENLDDQQTDVEVWIKADFPQFVWAFKAKCLHVLSS
jgi:hypothetical protein